MEPQIVQKNPDYILNHCTKYLARDNEDTRHSYFGTFDGQPRGRISEAWRFPLVDAHDGQEADRYEWNDVTFIYTLGRQGATPSNVELITTASLLHRPF